MSFLGAVAIKKFAKDRQEKNEEKEDICCLKDRHTEGERERKMTIDGDRQTQSDRVE